ncbi:hypothetical protein Sme01_55250 [Sphaerisporangium melleum]|uniref:hypothetical protein n=1 Tax=Sphaerisporangium melleum TaxID=321316 RepID=UPI00166BE2AF|nr:hypothetical protein [Sphaerisporangium melleum]GII73049.1 hypothetical protein Sme01_55250 [Sphaerisporangium melleum]
MSPGGLFRVSNSLNTPQRRAVRVLADLGAETWHWSDFTEILDEWNLPATQAACRAYAGLAPAG